MSGQGYLLAGLALPPLLLWRSSHKRQPFAGGFPGGRDVLERWNAGTEEDFFRHLSSGWAFGVPLGNLLPSAAFSRKSPQLQEEKGPVLGQRNVNPGSSPFGQHFNFTRIGDPIMKAKLMAEVETSPDSYGGIVHFGSDGLGRSKQHLFIGLLKGMWCNPFSFIKVS